MRALLPLLFVLGCDGAPPPPLDAGAADLELEAIADPAERTDCTSPPAAGEVRAKHVTCDAELVEGALAMGRVGDVVIENELVRFVVRTGDESATTIGAPSGGIVDAAAQGGTDLIKEVMPVFELMGGAPSAIEVVDAGGSGEARVRVLFDAVPIGLVQTVLPSTGPPVRARGSIDYVLAAGERALAIEVALTTERGVGTTLARVGVLAFLGGMEEVQPGYGVLEDGMLGGEGALLVGERGESAIGIALDHDDAMLLHVDTIHILRGARLSIQRGALARYTARLAPAPAADQAYAAIAPPGTDHTITGAPDDRIEIRSAGSVVLRATIGDDGRAVVPLGEGPHEIRAGVAGWFGDPVALDATHALSPLPSAILRVTPTVTGDDADTPVRVTVERGGEELVRFVAIGPTERRLPPGPARVFVSHGLEHDVFEADVTLAAGTTDELAPVLDRAIDTTGWVSVDLHLHSELSTDSVHPVLDALRMIAAEGLDVVSSTDHDFVTDYPALAGSIGLGSRLLVVPGEEVSTTTFGHVNGYPLARDPARAGAGAIPWFGLAPSEIFDGLRARGDEDLGGALVQVNHPRLSTGFFDAVGLDLATGRATADPASLDLPATTDLDDFDFDVIEVWNGYTRGDNEQSFGDYLALFAAGRRFAMVGNSDTHRPTLPAGSPRSFVRVPDDARGAFSWPDIATSLRARDVTVAAGVFVTAELAGPRTPTSVPVRIRAQAPPWVATDRLRIYAGTEVVIDRVLGAVSDPVRVDETIDVPLGEATFVVVRVDGAREPAPYLHFEPYGVTNALVVP